MKSTTIFVRLGLILFLGVNFLSSGGAYADSTASPPTVAVEPNLVVPLGDFTNLSKLGLGGTGTLNFPINAALNVTGRAGLIFHLTELDNTSFLVVPLLGGVKYAFSPGSPFYAAGELGLNYTRVSSGSVSDTDTNIGFTAGVGYKLSSTDLRAGLMAYDLGNLDKSLSLFFTASFEVATL